jgi:pimeloyl-ACP methyl ester carboxylesterase
MERQGRQYGGGGSNGTLITGLGPLRDARRTPVPIARGFATWGTDAGHQNEKLPEPRAFGLNDEANVNMAYASYKKTHDLARLVATAFYDRAPAKIYYGGSQGGREALMMAQRFPMDYDGIVAWCPQPIMQEKRWRGVSLPLCKGPEAGQIEGQSDRRRRQRRLRSNRWLGRWRRQRLRNA